jgi:hypothetical protein
VRFASAISTTSSSGDNAAISKVIGPPRFLRGPEAPTFVVT